MSKPKYNIYVSPFGNIRTKETPEDDSDHVTAQVQSAIDQKLAYIHGQTPMSLTTVATDRRVLAALYEDPNVKIEPNAKILIYKALNESRKADPPIMAPTDYELAGWIDTLGKLTAITPVRKSLGDTLANPELGLKVWPKFTPGKVYAFRYMRIRYQNRYTRPKMHYREATKETYIQDHDLELTGQDSGYRVVDDTGQGFMFRDNPRGTKDMPTKWVWNFFKKPRIRTISEANAPYYKYAREMIDDAEILNGFNCYPGQKHYVASVACTDSAAAVGETGSGKSLVAILLDMIKGPTRTLLVAPKGTVKDASGVEHDYDPAQWVGEFSKFNPDRSVFPLFSMKDYHEIVRCHGRMPPGVYITYPQAFFTGNGAFECLPNSWSPRNSEEKFRKRFGYKWDVEHPPLDADYLSDGIGETQNGITCIYKPSMATLLGDKFEMVILDEAHLICNPNSIVTRNLMRLQPKFKYLLTATPIPNIIYNIFPLLGWLAIRNWYHGGAATPRWPYRFNAYSEFRTTFTSKERDFTEEAKRAEYGVNASCVRVSPIISQVHKLLKLLKPLMAFITKEDCNPDLVGCNVNTVRVPFGKQQMDLYAHNLQIANIPHENPQTRYGVQMMRLRGICSDPLGRSYNETVTSNMNPKFMAILEKMAECFERGEQVVHVAAFQGQTNELASRLAEAGIPFSRIDATTGNRHAEEANMFKRGESAALLMGIKCAQAHSFQNCKNLIIGSLEWSWGSFNQALGRVYRLNSPEEVNIYVMLHKDSIEEMMFDKLATKRDAATICLHGEPIPREYKAVTVSEVFAEHYTSFSKDALAEDEGECELNWPALKEKLQAFYDRSRIEVLA